MSISCRHGSCWHTVRRLCLFACIVLGSLVGEAGEINQPADQAAMQDAHDYGSSALHRLEQWHALIRAGKHWQDRERLEKVNDFFNRMRFTSDIDQWGQDDYWATPQEMILANGGDCEDFSIGKYFTLREMGVAQDHLRLTYVKALKLNQAHMVLTYFATPDADPLVLDNLDKSIKRASDRTDLLPVYSFNGEGLWLARAHGTEQHIGSANRLSQWTAVIARIGHEQVAIR